MSRLGVAAMALGVLVSLAGPAHALEFKSIGAAPAILYDAPSVRGRKVFVAPRGMPVEVVLAYGDWSKVRDAAGDLSWVESNLLTPRRMLVAKTAGIKVRAAPDDNAALAFTCDKGVLLELSEPPTGGWLKVRHRDGLSGFVKVSDVWGA